MKTLLLISVSVILVANVVADKVDEILADEKKSKEYFDCLVDKANCQPEVQKIKENIPSALESGCPNCSQDEKIGIVKTITFLVKVKPDWWKELDAKYDPEGKFKDKYEEKLAEKGLLL